jgi:hypothetical protein
LWAVRDPRDDYHNFDVRYNHAVYHELVRNWKANADDQRRGGRGAAKADGRPQPSLKREMPGPGTLTLHSPGAPLREARPNVDPAGDSRAIGFWPKKHQLPFCKSTAIRHLIVFPDAVGGDFNTFLYQTSTNRSRKGTEAHIAFRYVPGEAPWFWIFDWSVCDGVLIRHVPVTKMSKWVFPLKVGKIDRKGVLVVNQTRLINDKSWINCVYLGAFENGQLRRFDNVYSNTYSLDSDDEQQPNDDFGFWGPEIESFQCYKRPINAMGFTGCWMIQDGKSIALDESNSELHNDGFGLQIFYSPPQSRDFLVH